MSTNKQRKQARKVQRKRARKQAKPFVIVAVYGNVTVRDYGNGKGGK
jgi:hypothetical protein